VTSGASLNEYMSRTVKYYSSLFTLPSHSKIILLLGVLCLFAGVSATMPLPWSPQTLGLGLFLGVTFFLATLLVDLLVSLSYMRTDPIYNLRRCSALSVFSWLIWLSFMFLGSIFNVFLESHFWVRMFFLGFCPVLMLRLLVFSSTSSISYSGAFVSSILQPAFSAIPLLFIGPLLGYAVWDHPLLLIPLFSILIAVATVSLFTFLLDRTGRIAVGIGSFSLFKAFLANWIADLSEPLEDFFEKLGVEKNIRVSLLGFRANKKMKAVMVIPECHRGPFKNVGSSLLPYIIQEALGNRLQCVVAVPHGLSGHERDLSSQLQNRRIVESILGEIDSFSSVGNNASPFVRAQRNGASASCQIFGDCAVFTLTLAPATTEDLPEELDSMIADEVQKAEISHAMVINAHNSIEGPANPKGIVAPLREAAVAGLRHALRGQRFPLEIGAATIALKEFSVEDGMGPGGISVIAAKVGDQKTAYITIDGNNMVSGLRERILSIISESGAVSGEILTTDTHAVNGVVRIARGYHPIGEAVDKKKLTSYVKQAVATALTNTEPAEVLWASKVVPRVKVVGKKQIEQLCLLAERTLSRAKRLAVALFSLAGILLAILLLIL